MIYDISIWEGIRSTVRWKTDQLVGNIHKEIPKDLSLAEFQDKQPVPWQLSHIIEQRANSWVQSVYDVCCHSHEESGKSVSADFDRAVWAYWIEPFIMGEQPAHGGYRTSLLLELLLCAVGSPPEKRKLLTVSQKDSCLSVRRSLWETWRNQLLHMPPSIHQRISPATRPNVAVVRTPSMAGGLLPDPYTPARQSPGSSRLSKSTSASLPPLEAGVTQSQGIMNNRAPVSHGPVPANWEAIEISFLSDERVQILNGTKRETCNYAEFGFADGRNGNPIKAWAILRAMAEDRGILRDGRKVGQAWPNVEKAIQEIRKALRHHFRISADPIPFV